MLRFNFFYVVVVAAFVVGVVFAFVSEIWFDIGCRRKFASSLSVLLEGFVEFSVLRVNFFEGRCIRCLYLTYPRKFR